MTKKEKVYKLKVTSTEEYELHIRTTANEDEVISRWRSFDVICLIASITKVGILTH